jgi:hypothetical protein
VRFDPLQRGLGPGVWNVLQHRYYIDAFYFNDIVRPIRDTWSAGVYWFNQNVLDAVVNGAAVAALAGSGVIMWIDRNIIDGAVNGAGTCDGDVRQGSALWCRPARSSGTRSGCSSA